MADIDYRKLTDKQLKAVADVNGDFSKLSDADFSSINDTLNPGLVRRAVNAVDANVITPINDLINWLGTQFTKAGTGLVTAPRSIADTNEAVAKWTGEKLGIPETGAAVGKALRWVNPNPIAANFGPSAAELNQTVFAPPAGGQPAPGFNLGVPEVNAGDNPALTLNNPVLGKVNVGKMLDVGAQAVPMAIAGGPGAILPNFFGGVTSEAAGQATHGTPWEIPARILGAFPGAWFGSKVTTPLPANLTPQQAEAVRIAKEHDVPLSVAQETGRGTTLERFLARMPGGQGLSERFAAKQGAVTDEAALETAGFKGNELGQKTMGNLATQAGAEFQAAKDLPGIIDLTPTFPKVREAVSKYEGVMDPAQRSPAVTTEANRILSKEAPSSPTYPPLTASAVERPTSLDSLTTAVQNASKPVNEAFDALPGLKGWFDKGPMAPMPKELPELSSAQYQTLRKGINEAIDGLYSAKDTNGARALQSMRTSLDDAVEASLGGDKLAAWQQARQHYSNFKILQRAMDMGTASARSEGTLGANALTNALRRQQGDNFYQTTGGLNDIATLKGYLRDTFPNSGTPTLMAQALGVANLPTAGLPALGINLAQRAMTGSGPVSSVVRNYLANQVLPNPIPSIARAPLALAPGFNVQAPPGYPRLERRQ